MMEFTEKTISVQGKNLRLAVWDMAGDQKLRNQVQSLFRDKPACIVTYDVTDRESFDNIEDWVDKLKQLANPECVIFVVGTKCDLADRRTVPKQEGEQLAASLEVGFMEVSAKTGENVEKVFTQVAEIVLKKIEERKFDLRQTSHGITRHGFIPKTEKITRDNITKKTEDTSICGKLFSIFSSNK